MTNKNKDEKNAAGKEVPEGYEELESMNFWNPEKEGDSIEGVVIGIIEGAFGKTWKIDTGEGIMGTPSHKGLQMRMDEVKVGQTVQLIFNGEVPAKKEGHSPAKVYTVYRKK